MIRGHCVQALLDHQKTDDWGRGTKKRSIGKAMRLSRQWASLHLASPFMACYLLAVSGVAWHACQ